MRNACSVIIGATPEGNKELVGLIDGVRESALSWKGLLLDLKRRGLVIGPELAVADGALGFWQAIEEVWPKTRGQRCWVHKTANVLNRLPKSQQSKAKRALQDIWMAETKKDANAAFDAFVETYAIKYDKAVGWLTKDREVLLAFYDHRAASNRTLKGMPLKQDGDCHGLQARTGRREKLAPSRRLQPVAKGGHRDKVHRRHRRPQPTATSRLTPTVTKIRR
jgi:transposase-like protein